MIETRTLSITQLFDDHVEKLKLAWVGAVGVEREVELPDMETYGPDVVGHLNLIYGHRVQVLGKAEQRWIETVGVERWRRQLDDLIKRLKKIRDVITVSRMNSQGGGL